MAKQKQLVPVAAVAVAVIFLLWLVRPLFCGELNGTFQSKRLPSEYQQFKNFVASQPEFFRTFWVPRRQRFGFWSNDHPAIDAEKYFTVNQCQEPFCSLAVPLPEQWGQDCPPNDRCYVRELAYFLNPQSAVVLSRMAVKYVVLPLDSLGEIFIAERQYNPQQRQETEALLDTVSWLEKVAVADGVAVYELPEFQDHFFTVGENIPAIGWEKLSASRYQVRISAASHPFQLIFSEAFDPSWQAKLGETAIPSQVTDDGLNTFKISQTGNFNLTVELTR
ncbi:hypothetical protein COT66_00990 [Candidatus Shapirobacteria bacterium CG09_land_8_20_14_0_10_49_15]|uniref:Uncharacterized protein n=1 Tax=Candidatus Shapirobacteria bacterium CG09_land_8_20_14_0_10_49_15 TaxID=1974482 RepID=A0A2M6XB49_9BACT|nr:MAG: hypothetical protein COT66_00990 [Candidatus Shapirobacteria bacterium CG09_land_8_20_14_0_10_49_15]